VVIMSKTADPPWPHAVSAQGGTFFPGLSVTSAQPGRAKRPSGLGPLLGYRPSTGNDAKLAALSCPPTSSAQQISYARFCEVR
jgi:hypothetical protein